MAKHSKRQKMYRMKGCSRKRCHRGGTTLAYTGEPIHLPPNPHLAYTGVGAGADVSRAYPSQGLPILPTGTPIWNSSNLQKGGCGTCNMSGGSCSLCNPVNVTTGGGSYPNGLVGSPINQGNINTLPGVDGIPGNNNYYPVNNYRHDISRQMQLNGGKRRTYKRRHQKNKKHQKQSGGGILPDEFINAFRYIPYTAGGIYNGFMGLKPPVNPLPTSQPGLNNANLQAKIARI